ncbi:carbohydrate ABC transporter permease [Anaerobacillus sp. CMMVII]|uniref:carbohydrate ABC transporter permease n=1 Tax=Anaerobacillus sp. CMMVII TaxID=2755588 RepID=UPI0021C4DB8D|nr:carbohydrate ABC transporter permease [Anaerobacillus sp. CMMVII]MCT8137058.1 carbohydrate ABC transporter permease [Anaerobacillus sp. CMMVII]
MQIKVNKQTSVQKPRFKLKGNDHLKKVGLTVGMLVIALFMIMPFLWMISTSLKTPSEVFDFPIKWIPADIQWDHHLKVWTGENSFLKYYANSLKIAVIGSVGAIFIGSLAAYGFAKIHFKGRDLIFLFYLLMMMVPPQVLFVPKFIMFDFAGIYNTHWALIIPTMFTIFGVFFLRQFFLSIPNEISESAFIDGAGHFRIFFQIFLPLAKPAIMTFAILDFSWNWNNYEDALVFLIDEKLFTVPLGLNNFVNEFTIDYNGMMAAASASIIPILILFFIGQRYIIQGVASSAVKG